MRLRIAYCCGIAAALIGCGRSQPLTLSPNAVLGIYVGRYSNGRVEVFTVRPDGTFLQSLTNNGIAVYSNEGKWEVDPDGLMFRDFILAVDVWNLNKGRPAKAHSFRPHWNPHGPAIVFSDDENYWIEKQTPKPHP